MPAVAVMPVVLRTSRMIAAVSSRGAHLICTQISAHIHEHLIDRIDMDILGSHILQIDLIDLLAVCHVKRHARLRDDMKRAPAQDPC